MVGFCVHCGASVPNEFVIKNGEILPSEFVRCSYCSQMAGIKNQPPQEEDPLITLLEKSGTVAIKEGKIVQTED